MAHVYVAATEIAAQIVGESPQMDALALKIQRRVMTEARIHRMTGDYMRSVKVAVSYTGKDRIVYSEDPGAIPIEYGFIAIRRVKGARRVQAHHVRGQYIFTKALVKM